MTLLRPRLRTVTDLVRLLPTCRTSRSQPAARGYRAVRPAYSGYGIPRPPGTEDLTYWTGFEVEQCAPLAGLSSIFNKGQSIDSGFAVNAWRLN